ncbi:MAG TPA: NADPH-dependent glutamate synthase [candidate division WOR-3 bacterium]|uniref:NADPH-dependent glutamate synthase n=1 Tax=candidate division WOR-3 bacterium TaxID=2052148 RepID=A0A7V0XEY1_UNCW3|nr:NADPH-dependent glutamate synthase [candidate division WOR-3 bacterium]
MAKPAPTRTPMREQDPGVRARNFDEVPHGYSPEEAAAEAQRCLRCKKPTCVNGCPVEVDIPGFIGAIAEGRLWDAMTVMKRTNVLPAICGRVCPQETQCEGECVLAKKMEPVAIGNLERFIADWEAEQNECVMCEKLPPTGRKVAVIGAGPAGLTVAGDCLKFGHEVTVFEALHAPGGVLVYGIPEFRLPKSIVEREVNFIRDTGAKLVTNFVVGMTRTIAELLEDFDAVFVGTGAGRPWFMELPGENALGIYSANEYLTRSNLMKAYLFPEYDTPIVRGKRVATIGGGNVAMDSARTALRLGAEESIIVYRRSRQEMPAREAEIHHAEQEGIRFEFLTNPVRYVANKQGWVEALECLRMELGEPDASGRRRPVPVKGSEFRIPVDTVVVAIGNSPNPLIPQTTPGLEVSKRGTIVVDPATGRTSKKGVFAGGDIVTGAATVILAMGAGRIAANSIDEYLKTGNWQDPTGSQ